MADPAWAPRRLAEWVVRLSREPVRPVQRRFRSSDLALALKQLGRDGPLARKLDLASEDLFRRTVSLSPLSEPLAQDYIARLARPVPALTNPVGVCVVYRSYLAHRCVELDPEQYGVKEIPVLGTLRPLRRGRPPQNLLSEVVKASRSSFEPLLALSVPAWRGFVSCLVKRAHDLAPDDQSFVDPAVVEGLARFGWVLRQADLHYHQLPRVGD
jgi:hypothetical protein